MLVGGKARGVCVVPLTRTYHWFKSMDCEDNQLEKGEKKGEKYCASYGLVGRMKHETELKKGAEGAVLPIGTRVGHFSYRIGGFMAVYALIIHC